MIRAHTPCAAAGRASETERSIISAMSSHPVQRAALVLAATLVASGEKTVLREVPAFLDATDR